MKTALRTLVLLILMLAAGVARATTITVSTVTISNWNDSHSIGVELWLFLDQGFVTSDGVPLQPGNIKNRVSVKRVACTVSTVAHTITIPAFTLDSTTDGQDTIGARYSAQFVYVTGSSVTPIVGYVGFSSFKLGPSPTTVSWADIRAFNVTLSPNRDLSAYSKEQSDRRYATAGTSLSLADNLTFTGIDNFTQPATFSSTINGLTLTTTTGTLTIANGKTIALNNSLNFSGSDSASIAFGAGGTVVYTSNNLSVFASTSSAQLAGIISNETGNGLLVFNNGPTFVAPTLGAALATSINGLTISSSTGTLTVTNGKTVSFANTLSFSGTDSASVNFGAGGTVAYAGGDLSGFGPTTSSQFANIISDETGTDKLVFSNTPTLVTPILGAATGTSLALGGGTALTTTNRTGTGNLVLANTPTLITPDIGVATGTSLALGGGTALSTTNRTGTGNLVLVNTPTLITPILGVATGTTLQLSGPQITAGTGTGVTVDNAGELRRQVYKVTVTYQALAAASTTADKTIATLPAKTRLVGIVADTTIRYAGGAASAATLKVGKSAGGEEYLLSHDVLTAAIVKGNSGADLGTALAAATAVQGGDLPSWTGTTTISVRLTTTGANTNVLSQGSTTYYIITEVMP